MNFDDVDLAIIIIGLVIGISMWLIPPDSSSEIIVGGITAIAALARGKPPINETAVFSPTPPAPPNPPETP